MRDENLRQHGHKGISVLAVQAGSGAAKTGEKARITAGGAESAPPCFLRERGERGALPWAEADGAAGHVFAVVVSDASGDMHWFGAATEAAALALAGDVGRAFSGEVAVFARMHRLSARSFPCRWRG